MNPTLTDKQVNYMNFINEFILENDNFPSFEVMAKHFKVNPGAAMSHLRLLEKKGYLEPCKNIQKYRRTNAFKSVMEIRGGNAA